MEFVRGVTEYPMIGEAAVLDRPHRQVGVVERAQTGAGDDLVERQRSAGVEQGRGEVEQPFEPVSHARPPRSVASAARRGCPRP